MIYFCGDVIKTSNMRGQVRSMDVGLCVPPVAHLVFKANCLNPYGGVFP